MPNKADVPPLVIGVSGLAAGLTLSAGTGYSLIQPQYFFFAVQTLAFIYAAYWAFDIRRGLPVSLFRNQALGIAVASLGIGIGLLASNVLTLASAGEGVLGDIGFLVTFLLPVVIFYWIDSTILASRRADPLGRDTFHWRSVRKILWGVVIASPLVTISGLLYGYLSGWSSAILSGVEPPPGAFAYLLIANILPAIVSLGTGLVILPVIARRSRDRAFRRHILWFAGLPLGVVISVFIVPLVLSPYLPPNQGGCPFGYLAEAGQCLIATGINGSALVAEEFAISFSYIGGVLGGFLLYRSAKSLVPMNRLKVEKVRAGYAPTAANRQAESNP